jgi:rhodanese-related sulfurtransferase
MNIPDTLLAMLNQNHISTSDVLRKMELGQVSIFDLNSHINWRSGHLPGALHIKPELFSQTDLSEDTSAEIVFYCSDPLCRKAPNAAKKASSMGFTNVKVMSAGISGWISDGYPIENEN